MKKRIGDGDERGINVLKKRRRVCKDESRLEKNKSEDLNTVT